MAVRPVVISLSRKSLMKNEKIFLIPEWIRLAFLNSVSKQLIYTRAQEFPELADYCSEYGKSNAIFEKCLSLSKSGKFKTFDLLPSYTIHFMKSDKNALEITEYKFDSSKPERKPDYTFMRLPFSDLVGFFLGEEN